MSSNPCALNTRNTCCGRDLYVRMRTGNHWAAVFKSHKHWQLWRRNSTFLFKCFFLVRKEDPSWMKARDQTRWRLASIQEKGINKESTSWYFEAVQLLSVRPKFTRASNVLSSSWRYKTRTLTTTTPGSVIFQSGGSVNQTESVLLCWVCMPSPRADKLAAVSFVC